LGIFFLINVVLNILINIVQAIYDFFKDMAVMLVITGLVALIPYIIGVFIQEIVSEGFGALVYVIALSVISIGLLIALFSPLIAIAGELAVYLTIGVFYILDALQKLLKFCSDKSNKAYNHFMLVLKQQIERC
jgi:predicted PurR-regulated permease PerM